MALSRLATIARAELSFQLRRPLFWVWIAVLALVAWGMSTGSLQISSGDSSVGGTKAWVTSQFSQAFQLAAIGLILYAFFVAVASGMSVLRDAEVGVLEILRSTPLTTGEYVWGKILGQAAAYFLVALFHVAANALCNHLLVGGETREIVGPFEAWNYLGAALWFLAPCTVLVAGTSFALGALYRRPILVFFLPVLILLVAGFFLWSWTPHWLSPAWDRVLMALDPAGLRWLERTWLAVDRGARFYNEERVGLDALFVGSRLALVALGLGAVAWTHARLGGELRGRARVRTRGARPPAPAPAEPVALAPASPLSALGMRGARPSFLAGVRASAGIELRELGSSPGLYLFAPLILLQTAGAALTRLGAFDTPLVATSGLLASASFDTLSILIALLLLFYMVESLERDRASGMEALVRASAVGSASLFLGKALANSLVGAAILAAALVGSLIVQAFDDAARFDLGPFLVLWGLLIVPTLVLWTSFVGALWCVLRNRFTTYGVALAALFLTFAMLLGDDATWLQNWLLWGAAAWSDMAPLELDRIGYVLNRVLALGLAAFLVALAVRFLPRRASDPVGIAARLTPRRLLAGAIPLLGWAAVPVAAAIWLGVLVRDGRGGSTYEKATRDTWTANLLTWNEVRQPQIVAAEIDLELEPALGTFRTRGTFTLQNDEPAPVARFAYTTGPEWDSIAWTIDGEGAQSEAKSLLHVLRPAQPLAPGARLALGFECAGRVPGGLSKRVPRASEMILAGGVVLTSFSPSFLPLPGFQPSLGADPEHPPEPKVYPDDFWVGRTPSGFGVERPFPVRVTIHGPAEYTYNSVGVKVADTVTDGRRTVEWRTDHPVHFFNVVAGRWAESRGEGVVIYHWPGHAANVPEMTRALEAARRWYGEWFSPFPWSELKLSEFPGYDGYAQGFPTNITFSESIGFLTNGASKADAPFLVTAHEAAHQWWGNRLVPGEGPGGNVLSEGMSHFSTILLFEEVKGLGPRIDFCKGIESRYGEGRYPDSERPLARVDGSRPGDTSVTYDKGGLVFWMLLQAMGRERGLAGYRAFLEAYEDDEDHPVLEDFLASMRPFAPDAEAFDAFAAQWFHDVVVPEYEILAATSEPAGEGRWRVRAQVRNEGTGSMPVEVAASRGVRFAGAGGAQGAVEPEEADAYREARASVALGAGQSAEIEIACDFEPQRVVVDPDALVLQLNRREAQREL